MTHTAMINLKIIVLYETNHTKKKYILLVPFIPNSRKGRGNKNRFAVAWGLGIGQGGVRGVDRYVPYIDCGDDFSGVYLCKTYQMVHF